jgi:predicted amidohydrolase
MVPVVAMHDDHPILRKLVEHSHNISLVIGYVEESPDFKFYNSALYLEDGRIVHRHRKVYLPTYGMFDELRYFAAGYGVSASIRSLTWASYLRRCPHLSTGCILA